MATLVRPALAPLRLGSLGSRIWAAYQLGRTRAQLRELPDYMLADIGVTRNEAQKGAADRCRGLPDWWRG